MIPMPIHSGDGDLRNNWQLEFAGSTCIFCKEVQTIDKTNPFAQDFGLDA